jgi:hypothetical protein
MKTKVETAAPVVSLGACAGPQAVGVVGERLVVAWAGSVGLPPTRGEYPLPAGRVVAVGMASSGPSVLMADGDLLAWDGTRWVKAFSLLDGEVTS